MSITMPRSFARVVLVVLLMCGAPLSGSVELIVNQGVPVTSVSRPLARLIFATKVTRWEDGSPIRVFVLPDESLLHQEMSKGILDLYPYQLRTAWDRVIYTGIGQAPITVVNEAEMRRQIASVPGAIGYVGRVLNNDKVRALLVR
jgi:ABC-type phosphate transport system substrate-binding protein